MKSTPSFETVDEYIATFPPHIQERLQEIRSMVSKEVPEAAEAISYQMPTFKLKRNLIHFAAFKNHIGVYPTPDGIKAFEPPLAPYKGAKGSVQFPHSKPLPLELIRQIVQYRVEQLAAGKK